MARPSCQTKLMQAIIQFRRISRLPARKYNTYKTHLRLIITSTIQQTQFLKTSWVRAVSLRSKNWMLEIYTSSTWLRFPMLPKNGKGKRRSSLHPYLRLSVPLTTRRTIREVTETTTRNNQRLFPLTRVLDIHEEHPVR